MFLNYFDKIICLTLERRPNRWEIALEEFKKYGLENIVEKFNGVDGKDSGILEQNLPMSDGVRLKFGEIGCTMSHQKIIEKCQKEGYENVLILEDDAEFDSNWQITLKNVIEKELPQNWDMLYLGGNHSIKPTQVTEHLFKIQHTYTTHAYAVNKRIFPKILETFPKTAVDCKRQVDVYYSSIQKSTNSFVIMPHIAWQKEGFSDIQEKNVNYSFLK